MRQQGWPSWITRLAKGPYPEDVKKAIPGQGLQAQFIQPSGRGQGVTAAPPVALVLQGVWCKESGCSEASEVHRWQD